MKNKIKYEEDRFLASWVAGELSSDEEKEFRLWLQSNPQKKSFFEEIRFVWQKSGTIDIQNRLTEEERWSAVSKRVFPQAKVGKATVFARIAVSAAAVILILLAAYFWSMNGQMVAEYAPAGVHKTLFLPDSSRVILNAKSSIRYTLKNWQSKREVSLTGEAFFKVKPGSEFIVNSDFAIVRVLGTWFNVKARGEKVVVACVKGKVSVTSALKKHKPAVLTANYASVVTRDTAPEPPFSFNKQQVTGWLTREFIFTSAPLEEVFEEMERQFNCKIKLKAKMGTRLFTGKLDGRSIEQSLDMICLSAGLQYSLFKDSTFVVY